MQCYRCGKRISKSASPAFPLGPRCAAKMFPKERKVRIITLAERDDKTPDLFDPLTADFVEKLSYMP